MGRKRWGRYHRSMRMAANILSAIHATIQLGGLSGPHPFGTQLLYPSSGSKAQFEDFQVRTCCSSLFSGLREALCSIKPRSHWLVRSGVTWWLTSIEIDLRLGCDRDVTLPTQYIRLWARFICLYVYLFRDLLCFSLLRLCCCICTALSLHRKES